MSLQDHCTFTYCSSTTIEFLTVSAMQVATFDFLVMHLYCRCIGCGSNLEGISPVVEADFLANHIEAVIYPWLNQYVYSDCTYFLPVGHIHGLEYNTL